MTDLQPWISLLIQVPLVAVFMWFVLEINKRQALKDAAHDVEMKLIHEQVSKDAAKRDEDWRAFLKEQRVDQHNDQLAVIELLSKQGLSIQAVSELMVRHDEWERSHALIVRTKNGGIKAKKARGG